MSSLNNNDFEIYVKYNVSDIRDKACINKKNQFQQLNANF